MGKNNYKIDIKIGEGGMGEVYRAFDKKNSRTVAIKILPPLLSANEEIKQRFLREMNVIAKLKHRNVISFYDYGESDGTLYYVMEYIDGVSVVEEIEAKGALTPEFGLKIVEDVLEALDYVHGQDLVHRDIKPANILIDRSNDELRGILMDFGLVKAFDSQLTMTGKVLGTPRYIAPEMLTTGSVNNRSDLFQLGIVLYEMVSGEYAFKGTTRPEVVRNCLTATPEPASQINPLVDVNLDNLIYNAIEKDPQCRYASANEMLIALRQCRAGKRIIRRKGIRPLPSKALVVADVEEQLGVIKGSLSIVEEIQSVVKEEQINVKEEQINVKGGQVSGKSEDTGVTHEQTDKENTKKDLEGKGQGSSHKSGAKRQKQINPFAPNIQGGPVLRPVTNKKIDNTLVDAKKRGTFFALLSLLLFVFLTLYAIFGGEIIYSVRGIAIAPSLSTVEITWRSDEEYPSRIEYGRQLDGMALTPSNLAPSASHVISLSGLRENSDYFFNILYPGGRKSSTYSFKTGKLEIKNLKWQYIQGGLLEVTWKTSLPTSCTLVQRGGGKEKVVEELDRSVLHRIVFEPVDVVSEISFFVKYSIKDGTSGQSDVKTVPSILSFGEMLKEGLTGFDKSKAVSQCLVSNYDFSKQSFFPHLQKFVPVADSFFASDHIPLSLRYRLYSEIVDCIALDVAVSIQNINGNNRSNIFKKALGGAFDFSEVTHFSEGVAQKIELPIPLSKVLGHGKNLAKSVQTPFLFRTDSDCVLCELSVSLTGMRPETVLRVAVNKDYILSIYNLSGHSADENVTYTHLCPASLMVDGTNVLKFYTERIDGTNSLDEVHLDEVTVSFQ